MNWGLVAAEVASLISSEPDLQANMANVSAHLYAYLNQHLAGVVNWCGFYRRVPDQPLLLLGPFQGKVACLRIPFGQGVCGAAAQKQETVVVADVEKFPGHIACDSASQSEVVIPVRDAAGDMIAILDVDSSALGTFTPEIVAGLEACVAAFQRPTPATPPMRSVKHAALH